MSQAASRASRREIRRAFGPEALDLLAQHNDSILALAEAGKALATDVKALNALRSRPILGRLRWLLVGR